ncbi:condensation domain-containing protein [Streptomyces erythrochromogenes]|uniref:condensation domain-containing protein n=1 Tax=Streptomyces erythrochromogenes TaxID=285574 RepID=UPI003416A4A3
MVTELRTLSAPQEAILAADVLSADPAAYTMVSAITVSGPVATDALRASAVITIQRHEALHWALHLDCDQRIWARSPAEAPPVPVSETDLTGLSHDQATEAVRRSLEIHRATPFDLWSTGPRIHFHLFHLPARQGPRTVCALLTHHLYIDEHGLHLLWTELVRRACRPEMFPALILDRRYGPWAQSTSSPQAGIRAQAAANEIARACEGHAPAPYAPVLPASAAPGSYGQHTEELDPIDLSPLAARAEVTETALLTAAVAQSVAEQTGERRPILHMPISLRRTAEEASIVGCFVTAAAMPVDVRNLHGPLDLAARCQQALALVHHHAHAAPNRTAQAIGRPQISLAIEQPPLPRSLGAARWTTLPAADAGPKHPLSIQMSVSAKQSGRVRLAWTPGALTPMTARDLVARIREHLHPLTTKG